MTDKNLFTYFFKKELTEVENKCNFEKCEDIIKLTIEHLYNEFCVF